MIIIAGLIAFVLLTRWQVVHLHDTSGNVLPWFAKYRNGDTIYWRGCRATVIDRKTVDMVIRRHLVGLILPRKR